jgi:leucyl/phenylalanyl-tRNA--protein transferase
MPVLLTNESTPLPDATTANADGLVAVGGALTCERLIEAYAKGIFPWTQNPVSWWSPPERAMFTVGALKISSSLRRRLRSQVYDVSIDRCFEAVIRACAHPHNDDDTWIGEDFIHAYTRLHQQGIAHSVECWENRKLVGGLYGLAVGGVFAGESMFYERPDASKIALVELDRHLQQRGFQWIDSQVPNDFTTQMGAVSVCRKEFLDRLQQASTDAVTF